MRSVRPTAKCFFAFFLLPALFTTTVHLQAQENSPYSRYGLGDLLPNNNILSRGMGGLSAAFADYQTINFANPASYADIKITTLDVGLDYNSRSLRALNPPRKFNSAYLIPSYLQLGFPVSKKRNMGMKFGLSPVTRINYNISNRTRITGIDSVEYNYVGNGGTYQASTGFAWGGKSLSVGINAGYMFGTKEFATRLAFFNDTVSYKTANFADSTRFGGLYLDAGIQYKIKLNDKTFIRLGFQGNLRNELRAKRNFTRETILFDLNQGLTALDSVYKGQDEAGIIVYPSSWKTGIMVTREDSWMLGAELGIANWQDYRYYGEPDQLAKSWTARLGGQFTPDYRSSNYWKRVSYRLGAYFGPDMIRLNKKVPQYSFTFGTALPVRRNVYTNQYTTINTAFELGFRGNKSNEIRENIFRIALGLNLSDIWFNKPKYQ